MTKQKLLDALDACRFHVEAYNDQNQPNTPLQPVRLKEDDLGMFVVEYDEADGEELGIDHTTLNHLIFMCEEGKRLTELGKREKAMRWLGFLQGVLWSGGFAVSLHTLKDMNKPEFVPDEEGGHFIEGKKAE